MEQGLESYFLGDTIYSREMPLLCSFPRLIVHMLVIRRGTKVIYLTQTLQRMKEPKLKVIRSGKRLEPFVPPMEDGSSCVKIPGIDVVTPSGTHLRNPYLKHYTITIGRATYRSLLAKYHKGAENIMDIVDTEPNPTECMWGSDGVNFKEELAHIPLLSGSVFSPNDDEVESIHRVNAPSLVPYPQHPLRAPQGGISVFDADVL
ncbi:hypothetical protein Cgig2_023934 [Carnegiea gigantea]|uniref:Uncharacterized protein n=1 Tax=Carnegiea gigantea TaxID=171969 RepID=A0A9Q1QAG8_9CARY|nr:hypothetical protein Cgig2_023934 [Carnegiea gigantea]